MGRIKTSRAAILGVAAAGVLVVVFALGLLLGSRRGADSTTGSSVAGSAHASGTGSTRVPKGFTKDDVAICSAYEIFMNALAEDIGPAQDDLIRVAAQADNDGLRRAATWIAHHDAATADFSVTGRENEGLIERDCKTAGRPVAVN